MTTGKLIQKYRKEKRLTQRELASMIGIAEMTMRRYENDERKPKIEIMRKMAKALGVSIALLSGEGIKGLESYSTEELLEEIQRRKNMSNKLVELKDLAPGSVFESAAGEHIVLGHDEAAGITKVIKKDFYGRRWTFDSDTCDYTKSSLRKKFNTEITEIYERAFEDSLVEHEVNLISVDMQKYDSFKCKVRPITFFEAQEFNNLLVNKDLPDWYWTCTPWSTRERGWRYSVTVVSPSGDFGLNDYYYFYGVRPFCILKSNLFVSIEEE